MKRREAAMDHDGDRPDGMSAASGTADATMARRLAAVLADVSDRLIAGERIDRKKVLADHPDLGRELERALDAILAVDSCVAPADLPAASPTSGTSSSSGAAGCAWSTRPGRSGSSAGWP